MKNISFLILILTSPISLAVPINPNEAVSFKELEDIIHQTENSLQNLNISEIINDLKTAEEERKKEELEYQAERIQNQNTLLWSKQKNSNSIGIGLYKRDFTEGFFFAAHLINNYLLYKKVEEYRKNYLLTLLKENAPEFINKIKEINKKSTLFSQQLPLSKAPHSFSKNLAQKTSKEFSHFIKNKCSYTGYNPIKQELLIPFGVSLFLEKTLTTLENKAIQKSSQLKPYEPFFKKDSEGKLVQQEGIAPISAVTIFKFFLSPRLALNNILNSDKNYKALAFINKICNLGIPAILFNQKLQKCFQLFFEFLTLGTTTQAYDIILNTHWSEYASKHKDQLLKLLENYQSKENPEKAEQDLADFINQGSNFSLIKGKHWLNAKDKNISRLNLAITLPFIGLLGYKAYNWYKSAINPI